MAEFGCLYSEVLLTRNAWEKRKLGEVATITMGQSPDSKNYTLNPQDHILVQGNADIKNGWVEPRVWTTQITKIAKKGSVLLSVRAPVGEVSKTAFDVVLGRGVASVGQTDFLYQYLITLKINGFWLRYSTGSTFDSINSADIKDAIIFLPEKNEQSRIAKTLNCIDNLIAATQHKIDALEQTKKALLQRLFDQSWRFKGYSDPWEKRKLGEIAGIFDGTHQTPNYQSSGIMFLSVENIQTLKSNKFISLEDFQKDFKVSPRTGDILMTRIGNIGTTNVVKSTRPIAYYVSLALIRPNDAIDVYCLNYAINGLSFQRELRRRTLSVAFPQKINKQEIGKSIVDLPSPSEQIQIGNLFVLLDNLIAATQSRLSSLELLKKALLQDLFI